ncbi:disulfide bond formation protein DsbA [Vandammella animalimorsus]|uniref:Disulfide bond formation protein DsbA n=1 Tax=Vandammella animalimorsus TaxID=2029117 RepID=A0A2A2AH86_9BURK|nr:DsbA family protein [Vandammella animalimorsus]PAT37940.1 disulfide bond formation protein DsbA [Vandammella animalimorsus]
MQPIHFYFDFVSPYAHLAFQALPQALKGSSYQVLYKPVLLGALFKAQGVTSPASIASKHGWIRRHTQWLAEQQAQAQQCLAEQEPGTLPAAMQAQQQAGFAWPAQHPFNSLPLLRLAMACSTDGSINRYTAQCIFEHVWQCGGADALQPERLAQLEQCLAQQLRIDGGPDSALCKELLRANTDQAQAAGVFGVPAFVVDGQLFWGLDALPMLRERIVGAGLA